MPPLTGEAERFAPRATGFCIDERLLSSGRSRVPQSGLSCQGSILSASLAPRSSLHEQPNRTSTEPQALRMLDEPSAPFSSYLGLVVDSRW